MAPESLREVCESKATLWSAVAACGYNLLVTSTGIRELKDNLSRYIRQVEGGKHIAITAHGRVVAELVPPGARTRGTRSRFDELVASGVIRPPVEAGDPTEGLARHSPSGRNRRRVDRRRSWRSVGPRDRPRVMRLVFDTSSRALWSPHCWSVTQTR